MFTTRLVSEVYLFGSFISIYEQFSYRANAAAARQRALTNIVRPTINCEPSIARQGHQYGGLVPRINAARYGSLYLRLLLRRIASPSPAPRPPGGTVPDGIRQSVGRCCIYSRHVLISASRHRSSAASRLQSSLFPAPYMPRYGPAAAVSDRACSAPLSGEGGLRLVPADIAIEIRRREVI